MCPQTKDYEMHKTILTSAVALSAAAFLMSASPAALAAGSNEPHRTVSPAPDHQNLTIYPGFGIVQQTNPVDVVKDGNSIQLDGIAGQYEPSSLLIVNVNGVQFKVKDVTYQPANLDQQNLLAGSVGTDITVSTPTGPITGKLKSYVGNILTIEPANSPLRTISDPKDVQYSQTPPGLSATPTLTLNVEAPAAGKGTLQILYKTGGISWAGRYSVTYNEQASTIDLTASAAIDNHSGTNFKDAGIKVVSGNAQDFREEKSMRSFAPAPMAAGAPGGASFDEAAVSSVGEQKGYTLSTAGVDLRNGEIKQVPYFGATAVPVERVYYMTNRHAGGDYKQDAGVRLLTTNDAAHHLNKSLPDGTVRFYAPEQIKAANGQPAKTGDLQLSASGKIASSEPGEKMTLEMGTSRDIKATWSLVKQTEAQRQPNGKYTPTISDWSVAFTNAKDKDVMVKVYEAAGNTTVTQTSSKFSPEGGQQFTWVKVPAHGSATVTYTTVVQNN
jgi:hypothetical protein